MVSWVDGSDPVHRAKRERVLREHPSRSFTAIPGGKASTRFADSGEVELCIRGMRRHCPWLRTIHLVTDQQVPAFLDAAEQGRLGVSVVDHSHLFRGHEWALPTFSSRSIETAIHRIEGLSERFVYFNDDMLVLRATGPEEFFLDDGVVLRGQWKPLRPFGPARVLLSSIANHLALRLFGQVRSVAVLAQYRAAQLAGFRDRYLDAPHTPYPMRRSRIEAFFRAHPEQFERNIGFRFRDMAQFVTAPLARHLEIAAGTYEHRQDLDYLLICFNRDTPAEIERKIGVLESGSMRFLCLQGFENASAGQRTRLLALLAAGSGLAG